MKRKTLEELQEELARWSQSLENAAMLCRGWPWNEMYQRRKTYAQKKVVQLRNRIDKRRTK
jgi:hypothetical protein